jgi:hypothetical protein
MTPEQARAAIAAMAEADFPTDHDDIDDAAISRLVAAGRKAAAGRPSLTAPGARSPQITLRLPAQLCRRLDDACAQSGRRRSQVVREALETYLSPA